MKTKVRNMNIWLIVSYVAMIILSLWLNQQQTIDGIIVNIGFFFIVALIFFFSIRSFSKANKFNKELRAATYAIRCDYEESNKLLWDKYKKADAKNIFVDEKSLLSKAFNDYKTEMERLGQESLGNCKCDIETYINYDLIDSSISKSLLNIVPGVMTGLGILGTFIGLSFGLNNFNTGSADEITNSIPPLMNGIKVAFHTSIYGMIFSLIYNWVYKKVTEDTYKALDEFVEVFYSYVCPDSFNDNVSSVQVLIKEIPEQVGKSVEACIQRTLAPTIESLSDTIHDFSVCAIKNQLEEIKIVTDIPEIVGTRVENSISQSLTPALESMTKLMQDFSENVTTNQLEGLKVIIDSFVENMNAALGNQLKELGKVIEETSEIQKENNEFIKGMGEKLERVSQNVIDIDDKSKSIIDSISSYIDEVVKLQSSINEGYMSVNIQIEDQKKYNDEFNGYIEKIISYIVELDNTTKLYIGEVGKQLEATIDTGKTIAESSKSSMDLLTSTAEEQNQKLIENSKQFAESIEKQFETIEEFSQNISNESKRNIEEVAKCAEEQNAKLIENSKEFTENLEKQFEIVEKTSQSIVEESKLSIETISQSAEEGNNRLTEACKKQIDAINAVSTSTTNDMDKAAKELARVSDELDKKLDNKLTYTFGKIDQSLADIAGHLSGTIVQINDTLDQVNDSMERLPKAALTANEAFRQSLDSMQENVEGMKEASEAILQSLSYLQESIEEANTNK